tara:strand:- start:562 stop:1167 length:606 start_codon:yes stop_codon:yes gene_type:complete
MKLIGLSGGIASGKSTVEKMLSALGANIVDADQLYHRLLQPEEQNPSPLTQRIVTLFPSALQADGTLDRKTLGSIVFQDENARKQLEALTHPEVARAFAEHVEASRKAGATHCIYSVPLLFEKGLEESFDATIVVWVPEEIQGKRLKLRDGLTNEEIESRLRAQMPLNQKRDKATWVIDNSGSLEATKKAVAEIWKHLALD